MKWELMKPILTDPNANPPPIIPSVSKSRPPVFSKELTALVTSEYSRVRSAAPLRQRYLTFPPNLSLRADPSSSEAHTLGPLSKRLEVNFRWRYFTRVWKKVYPPLNVFIRDPSTATESSSQEAASSANIRGVCLQGSNIFEAIENVVGKPYPKRQTTCRERKSTRRDKVYSMEPVRHPSRWVRRRYQRLLGRLPALIYRQDANAATGSYRVELSAMSLLNALPRPLRQPEVDPDTLAWYELSKSEPSSKLGVRNTCTTPSHNRGTA
ncbi:hypothetical protein E1B28_000891 [Marasmius oreades]|nr:uncharacterized protein E1B28_000891 [Marasmius oreades]KAG7099006.1 hypothetical protein E1B28_000891 [Marasmius oreades]